MQRRKLKIVLSGELVTLNLYSNAERTNRFAGASIKSDQTLGVMYEVINKYTPVKNYPVSITIHWYRKNRKVDPDNISFAKKFILDGLKEAGILENDGWNQIAEFHDLFSVDKKNPRIEIEITEGDNHAKRT